MTHYITDGAGYVRSHRSRDLPIGFTPIRNKRIEAAIAAMGIELLKAGKASPNNVHREAVRIVAATLPALPFARRHRLPRPSKNDCPVYRKQACAVA